MSTTILVQFGHANIAYKAIEQPHHIISFFFKIFRKIIQSIATVSPNKPGHLEFLLSTASNRKKRFKKTVNKLYSCRLLSTNLKASPKPSIGRERWREMGLFSTSLFLVPAFEPRDTREEKIPPQGTCVFPSS